MKVLNPTDFCNVENYSKIFKDKIKNSFVSIENTINYFHKHCFSVDLVDDILKELHDEYGVEENDENFKKLKKEIFYTIACKMENLADGLCIMAKEYKVK